MRAIHRRGQPIPFPTDPDEYFEIIVAMARSIHVTQHHGIHEGRASAWIDDRDFDVCQAPVCRFAKALVDPAYRCPDPWHLQYQPGQPFGLDACPTCSANWIATEAGANGGPHVTLWFPGIPTLWWPHLGPRLQDAIEKARARQPGDPSPQLAQYQAESR